MWTNTAKMVSAIQGGQDRRLKSPFLTKKDDPVTYQLLFGTMPLKPTYIQLEMADQTFRKVIDMGEDEYDPPIILRRPFLSTVKAIIYIGTGEVHMHFPSKKKTTQLQLEEANLPGWMGRLRRRSGKVRRHTT